MSLQLRFDFLSMGYRHSLRMTGSFLDHSDRIASGSVRTNLTLKLLALLIFVVSAPFAAEAEAPPAQPTTTSEPSIPVDELALLLKPLTKDELLVEAAGWQALLKAKAEGIARAEIAVKRQNREIDRAEEIQDKAVAAKEQLDEVKMTAEEARASGDMAKFDETDALAREAREKVQAVGAAVDEAVEAAKRTAEVQDGLPVEKRECLEGAAAAVQ